MTATTLLILLTAHFVADFCLQTDWMATRKSKDIVALSAHVWVYTTVMLLPLMFIAPYTASFLSVFYFYLITFATHFVTDAITSRITSKLWFFKMRQGVWTKRLSFDGLSSSNIENPWTYEGGNRHWFFVTIGFDQLIHAWTLALTWIWVMR